MSYIDKIKEVRKTADVFAKGYGGLAKYNAAAIQQV